MYKIRLYISNQDVLLTVDTIIKHRYNNNYKQFQLLVKWRGFQQYEATWENIKELNTDIPVLISNYVQNSGDVQLKEFYNKFCLVGQ